MGRLGLLGCLGALVLILLIGGGWFVGVRNHMVELDQAVQAQWAQVENDYQRRYDLIPNLVRTVQGAANFEKSTLEAVVNARSRVGQVGAPASAGGAPGAASDLPNNPQALAQFEQAQAGLSNALSRLLVVVERYPELKSNQNFLELQSQLEGTENRIAVERRRFNEAVREYNTRERLFPGSVLAGLRGFREKAFFGPAPAPHTPPPPKLSPSRPPSSPPSRSAAGLQPASAAIFACVRGEVPARPARRPVSASPVSLAPLAFMLLPVVVFGMPAVASPREPGIHGRRGYTGGPGGWYFGGGGF